MLSLIALAAAAAATPASAQPALPIATAPWWEKVTMTIDGAGSERNCSYQSSLAEARSTGCEMAEKARARVRISAPDGVYTKLTFERRFSPGMQLDVGALQPGDTLLGGQIIALSIGVTGAVEACRVVVASPGMTPTYGCEEARSERFAVHPASGSGSARFGYMTILVYGHMEQLA